MKIPKPILLLLVAILTLGAVTPPKASAQVSASFFYTNLHSYGEWVNCSYGYCWHPTNVAANWAPYSDGYWAYTDCGWTWVSYEDYGGIVYHYGRWVNITDEGWVWVPGTQWAPAWVSWRSNHDYIGWAPLPPEAVFRVGFGFGGWVDARFNIGPGCYNFVDCGHFGEPALAGVIVNREQNVTIINNTTNITNITNNNTTVYTGGPNYTEVAARSTRPIPRLHLVRQGDAAAIQSANGKILSHQQGNQLVVLAPKITPPAGGKFPAPPEGTAKNLSAAKVNHGWSVVKDPQQRAQLQAKVKSEGTNYTPAKAVDPADVKLVTDKASTPGAGKPPTAEETTKPTAMPGADLANGKGEKTGKNKPADTADFVNTPAAEGSATPKPGKGKKNHTLESGTGDNGTAGASPTPKNKKKNHSLENGNGDNGTAGASPTPKNKKKNHSLENGNGDNGTAGASPTPKNKKKNHSLESGNNGNEGDASTPKPKKNKGSNPTDETDMPKHSNLQPFVNGDAPKPKIVHPPGGADNAGQKGDKPKGKGSATPAPQ